MLYHRVPHLFSKMIEAKTCFDFYELFDVHVSSFCESHYTFNKESKPLKKKLSKAFIDLLLINTVQPIIYTYLKKQGKIESKGLISLIHQISSEKNNIITKFNDFKPISKSALHSQALIQLKESYCSKNQCLKCAIGNAILN